MTSCLHSAAKAEKRAKYVYHQSAIHASRVSVAKIKTAGLVPAFFEATLVILVDVDDGHTTKGPPAETIKRVVKIPIWVNESVVPKDR